MQEFDVSVLMDYSVEIAEVGRSCVDPLCRSRGVMQLLWRGLSDYIEAYNVKILFGCASFHGAQLSQHAASLSYLHHYHLAPPQLRPHAQPHRYVSMEHVPRIKLNPNEAEENLPPLIKGYLRIGGFVGQGAVVDHQFGTVDVCIIVKTDQLAAKYQRHYKPSGKPSEKLLAPIVHA
jgi:putative hemolysin